MVYTVCYCASIFSSAVFEKNVKVLSKLCCQRQRLHRANTLTFSNISVITEDIYLKLRIVGLNNILFKYINDMLYTFRKYFA